MPFSVKIWCKTGFRKPRHVLRYASSGEQKPHCAQDLRRNLLFNISMPFSVDLVQGGFRKPRRVLRYASLGEQKPHRAEDLRCVLFKLYSRAV